MKTSTELRYDIYLTTLKLKKAERVIGMLLKKMNSGEKPEQFEKDIEKFKKARKVYHRIGMEIQNLNEQLSKAKINESNSEK